MAPATEKGYAHDFRQFEAFCKRIGRRALPASSITLSLFVADQLATKKVVTVMRYAAGASFIHKREGFQSPFTDRVHEILRAARRARAEQPRQMHPLSIADIRKIATHLNKQDSPAAVRNRAIVLVGFASALRRTNLSEIRIEDVTFCDKGMVLLVRREKQNREGAAGRKVAVPFGRNKTTCPVRALEAWLKYRGKRDGPLFTRLDRGSGPIDPLSLNAICRIVQESIADAGLDARNRGTHSLRSGLISEAGEAGVSELVLANHTGHRSLDSLKIYFRPARLFKHSPAGCVGL